MLTISTRLHSSLERSRGDLADYFCGVASSILDKTSYFYFGFLNGKRENVSSRGGGGRAVRLFLFFFSFLCSVDLKRKWSPYTCKIYFPG